MPELGVIIVLLLVLGAEFVNGFTDAPNAIATVISTRVLRPNQAILMAVVFNILGVMSGTAVAFTIGKGIVKSENINLPTIAAAMIGSIVWCTITWAYGLPVSKTHAVVAGLAGAGLAIAGPKVLLWSGWAKILVGLAFSSCLGFLAGLVLMIVIYKIFSRKSPRFFRKIFGKIQILSSAFMAFSHGTNDGQKFIGVFALVLVLAKLLPTFSIPLLVIFLCATVMGIGTAFGGFRIIRTIGLRLTKLDPVHGFAAETGAALAIQFATFFGIPLSTTHTIDTAIMGVGATKRFSAVRWGVGRNIVMAWILTFPISGLIAWSIASLFKILGVH